jgi:hypothetical protein
VPEEDSSTSNGFPPFFSSACSFPLGVKLELMGCAVFPESDEDPKLLSEFEDEVPLLFLLARNDGLKGNIGNSVPQQESGEVRLLLDAHVGVARPLGLKEKHAKFWGVQNPYQFARGHVFSTLKLL